MAINIDGIEYIRADSVSTPGDGQGRNVVVLDNGWIYAGDLTEDETGRCHLTNVIWVFRWESIGFSKVIENPLADEIDLRPMAPINYQVQAEIFRVPVGKDWGIRPIQ